jgi:PPM family protein phosphatase
MNVKGYGCSVIGSREMNQDSFLVNNEMMLYAVADGVGGGMRGEVASQMAVAGLKAKFQPTHSMKPVFEELQQNILKEAMDSLGEPIMGTTFTALSVSGTVCKVCHVGDSRCYLFGGGVLKQLTEDQEFFDENIQATVLASYLGIPTDLHPLTILEETFPIKAGYSLLLCSDGLYRQMTEPRMVELIKHETSNPENLVKVLCDEASKHEYSDNVTCIYVTIG